MQKLKISTAQFEHRSGDKSYNLGIIEKLSEQAAKDGSQVVAFHECSITGYTFARHLSKEQMLQLAEFVPDGKSVNKLIKIAETYNIAILAGLFEKDNEDRIFKTYISLEWMMIN